MGNPITLISVPIAKKRQKTTTPRSIYQKAKGADDS
jgi:hypothetical protein